VYLYDGIATKGIDNQGRIIVRDSSIIPSDKVRGGTFGFYNMFLHHN
jgi:hypothetical protein